MSPRLWTLFVPYTIRSCNTYKKLNSLSSCASPEKIVVRLDADNFLTKLSISGFPALSFVTANEERKLLLHFVSREFYSNGILIRKVYSHKDIYIYRRIFNRISNKRGK